MHNGLYRAGAVGSGYPFQSEVPCEVRRKRKLS